MSEKKIDCSERLKQRIAEGAPRLSWEARANSGNLMEDVNSVGRESMPECWRHLLKRLTGGCDEFFGALSLIAVSSHNMTMNFAIDTNSPAHKVLYDKDTGINKMCWLQEAIRKLYGENWKLVIYVAPYTGGYFVPIEKWALRYCEPEDRFVMSLQ